MWYRIPCTYKNIQYKVNLNKISSKNCKHIEIVSVRKQHCKISVPYPIWEKSQTHEKRKENKQERQNSYIPLVIITNDTWYDIESSSPWYTLITASSINDSIFHVIFPSARRRIARDVYDRRPEEVLRGHEEDGEQEAGQGNAEAKGELSISLFAGVTLTLGANIVCGTEATVYTVCTVHAGTVWGSNI